MKNELRAAIEAVEVLEAAARKRFEEARSHSLSASERSIERRDGSERQDRAHQEMLDEASSAHWEARDDLKRVEEALAALRRIAR